MHYNIYNKIHIYMYTIQYDKINIQYNKVNIQDNKIKFGEVKIYAEKVTGSRCLHL